MQFFSVIGTLATIASLVSATAIPATPEDRQMMGRISNPLLHSSRPGNIAKRDTGLYFCTDADYEGLCYRDKSAAGTCVNLEDDLDSVPDQFGNTISSASVNEGSRCTLFRDAHCEGPTLTISYPGSHDLYFEGFNDMTSSFRCENI